MADFRLSNRAEDDLTQIWTYTATYSDAAANALIETLIERFLLLAQFQDLGRDRQELQPGLKSFPSDRYVIFYRVIPEGIEIVRVLHGSRDTDQLF